MYIVYYDGYIDNVLNRVYPILKIMFFNRFLPIGTFFYDFKHFLPLHEKKHIFLKFHPALKVGWNLIVRMMMQMKKNNWQANVKHKH